ncbi:hypothetical protein SARC_04858 [Sphaeroforma arctica JP610]|uniref:Uncharacterized protein n=1 Tax=Sphaeroforma arctica JP610 TaxID=667725 RepID=A0A0L0G3R9_9EUKA|nr:hypothetical protein SARC_04858 [Sphaeroforma arctica JP610]KNC82858.1 hypothetical protein SARC_04858 [Sphaeroforma arctica JP610]|eukprot:XP_014156760.1 hypothetical protein SARC_04858 [Sphaeroforma arctica JP610]
MFMNKKHSGVQLRRLAGKPICYVIPFTGYVTDIHAMVADFLHETLKAITTSSLKEREINMEESKHIKVIRPDS